MGKMAEGFVAAGGGKRGTNGRENERRSFEGNASDSHRNVCCTHGMQGYVRSMLGTARGCLPGSRTTIRGVTRVVLLSTVPD